MSLPGIPDSGLPCCPGTKYLLAPITLISWLYSAASPYHCWFLMWELFLLMMIFTLLLLWEFDRLDFLFCFSAFLWECSSVASLSWLISIFYACWIIEICWSLVLLVNAGFRFSSMLISYRLSSRESSKTSMLLLFLCATTYLDCYGKHEGIGDSSVVSRGNDLTNRSLFSRVLGLRAWLAGLSSPCFTLLL